jgi:FADH2 O2-dependent halogenase
MTTTNRSAAQHDVIILGSGLAGSVLAAALARQGLSVLLVDNTSHPRFAIGESMVPRSSQMLRIIGQQYDIPEVLNCSSFHGLQQHVAASCGVKKHFGFVYHRQDEPHRMEEATQAPIPRLPHGPESHLYRQDIDAYLTFAAVKHGAQLRSNVQVVEVEVEPGGCRLLTNKGEELRARYVVDASGTRSPLAEKFKLRAPPDESRTNSWSIFTHMIGVRPFEDCLPPGQTHKMPERWSQGTLHHIFDGGWFWVIPFDNYSVATNPLCSVGVNLDGTKFPRTAGLSAEQEFKQFVARFPSMERQFRDARAVREWVATGRLQYNSTRHAGDRFFLLGHAGGFIDALHSRGIANTFYMVHALAERLPHAVRADDFSYAYFRDLAELQGDLINYNDRLVNGSYCSFMDFDLWNAWSRVWLLGVTIDSLRIGRLLSKHAASGRKDVFHGLYRASCPGSIAPDSDEFETIFNRCESEIDAARAHRKSPAAAAEAIHGWIATAKAVPPTMHLKDRKCRYTLTNSFWSHVQYLWWRQLAAPREVRKEYFDYAATPFVKSALRDLLTIKKV